MRPFIEDNDALAAFKAALDTTTGAANPEIKQKIKFLTSKVKPSSTVFSFGNKGRAWLLLVLATL